MNNVAQLVKLLETYRGHDQTLSLIGYGSKMLSDLASDSSGQKLRKISAEISNCRVILRLLDDWSMLAYTLSYGLGKQEKSIVTRALNVISNISSHIYYISEHIAWLADNKVLKLDSGIYWVVSILAWLLYLICSIICNFIYVRNIIKEVEREKDKLSGDEIKTKKINWSKRLSKLGLRLLEDLCYLINCIHWLPPGILWSGKLSNFASGLLGVISVSCNLITQTCF